MRYGITLPNGGNHHDPRTLASYARLAEEAGWDGVFLEDYIIWQGHQDVPTFDTWTTLAAIAVTTNRVRIGPTVTPLPRRRPWTVARQAVTLDHLSSGRLILGVGLGDTAIDNSLTLFGEKTSPKARATMVDEALEIITKMWSGEPFAFDGEFYHVQSVHTVPSPLQTRRIPIWVGGVYPKLGVMLRASRWDGACLYKDSGENFTPDEVRHLKSFIEAHRQSRGPYDIVLGGGARGADWEAERALINALGEAGATWWCEYMAPEIGGDKEVRSAIERGPLRS